MSLTGPDRGNSNTPEISRKRFIETIGVALGGLMMPSLAAAASGGAPRPAPRLDQYGIPIISEYPVTGVVTDPAIAAVDNFILSGLKACQVPGAVCCVTWDNKVILNRGYGYSNRECTQPTSPDTLMRIASCDKPLIKAALRRIFEEGRKTRSGQTITRHIRLFEVLEQQYGIKPPAGKPVDPRIYEVTLDHLMEHKSGVVHTSTDWAISNNLQLATPPQPVDFFRYCFNRPLRFAPGSKSEYSNMGFQLLRYFTQMVAGNWFQFVRESLLKPAGVAPEHFVLSRTDPKLRDPKETWYWSIEKGQSALPGDNRKSITTCNGAMHTDTWLSPAMTAEAYARYMCCWTADGSARIINPSTRRIYDHIRGGLAVYLGGMPGTSSAIYQNTKVAMNVALFFNRAKEGHGGPAPQVIEQIKQHIEQTSDHWQQSRLAR